jgi:hypothetical protein
MHGEPVVALHERYVNRGILPTTDEIYDALFSVIYCYSKTYIIIDALDDCMDSNNTHSELLALLRSLQDANTNLMVTSRFVTMIEELFIRDSTLEIRASREDIIEFVDAQMHRLPTFVKRDLELQGEVRDKIAQKSDGM